VWNFEHQESGSLKTGASELKRSYIYGEYMKSDGARVTVNQQRIIHFSMEMGIGMTVTNRNCIHEEIKMRLIWVIFSTIQFRLFCLPVSFPNVNFVP
jgi:hypothetical protein